MATLMAPKKGPSTLQKQVDNVVEECRGIFSSPTWVPFHCHIEHLIEHLYPVGQYIKAPF